MSSLSATAKQASDLSIAAECRDIDEVRRLLAIPGVARYNNCAAAGRALWNAAAVNEAAIVALLLPYCHEGDNVAMNGENTVFAAARIAARERGYSEIAEQIQAYETAHGF